ncbi:DegT/DnrJ/EryC1/StrS family aminotransferase [Acidobacteria bacterium AH-259-G07]|nr:DegT/DnrJ/EryC1/StrS family aminotransferase [Acidobacteria bacterium AH-259-G07]
MSKNLTRRHFVSTVSAGTAGMSLSARSGFGSTVRSESVDQELALLGGKPVRTKSFPSWPVIAENDRKSWKQVLESKNWFRSNGHYVTEFEESWARRLGARFVVATSSGTSALYTSLFALDIGPGDEVIVPPYTFVATINVVLLHHALPVLVDSDRETSQIDANKIEAAITDRTRCILPVHLGGNVAEMDKILEISQKYKLSILEDACQAHLAEWRGKKAGTVGDLGCFSFQASKNLNSGEGGAIASNNAELMKVCSSFHNAGRGYSLAADGKLVRKRNTTFSYERNGDNRRMTEFQGSLLLEQLTRLEEQARTRERNAQYLTRRLNEIPGIIPARQYEGCTRNAYHLYMLRYDRSHFANLPRSRFLEALRAEGIPGSGGYRPLNKEPFLKHTLESRAFRSIYSAKQLAELEERNHCPENDKLCSEAVWFGQSKLLGPQSDMDDIAAAIRKIQKHAAVLVKAG